MKIKHKLSLGALGLAFVPLVLMAALLVQGTTQVAGEAVDTQVRTQLEALRDLKSQQVQDEINNRLAALRALAASRATVEAARQFKSSFYSAGAELLRGDEAARQAAAMQNYVAQEFGAEFTKRNPGAAPSLADVIGRRDANATALQHHFITVNPNPLGAKDKLVSVATATNRFAYNEHHAAAHPSLEKAQKLFGFYDVFIIDTSTDQVVYTVFKELDFGSRLSDGIAAKSKLAEAYYKVKNAKDANALHLSDFEPYLASYNDQAAFAAVPLFDGDRQIGVLAVQFPIDRITSEINSNKRWASIGLGQTGDAYLVGADGMLRTDVRDVLTAKAAFLNLLGARLSATQRELLEKKNTSIGLVNGTSDATRKALAGERGVGVFDDYRGQQMVLAYAPVKIEGLSWGIVTGLSTAEAGAPVRALTWSTLLRAALITAVVLAVVGALMVLFVRRFMRPIDTLHGTVQQVAGGNSTARTRLAQPDELGELGRAFDKLLDERIAQLETMARENEQLNNSVIALLETVFQLSNKDLTVRAAVTEDVIGTLSSSINQLSDETGRTLAEVRRIADEVRSASEDVNTQAGQVDRTARGERQRLEQMAEHLQRSTTQLGEVVALTERSNRTAEQAGSATDTALRSVAATVRGMDQLRDSISETEKRFKRLGERSQEISAAVSLINTISERTHVLALNASMQAATAGEAGRGFAVVAEEVQRLSESSRQATQQISQLVQNIQIETNETIYTMNRLISQVVTQSDQAQQAGEQMDLTRQTTAELVALVQQIAAFSRQQALMAQELQQSVGQLNQGSEATVSAIGRQSESTQTLVRNSQKLAEAVAQFTLPPALATAG
jgi:methyl-accepting chemotaxis protein